MKDFQIRFVLKNKKDGKTIAVYPPLLDKANGLMKWPIDLEEWEVISVDRCTEVEMEDNTGEFLKAYEGDTVELVLEGKVIGKYEIKFKDGIFAIDIGWRDEVSSGMFSSWSYFEYHAHKHPRPEFFVIPISELNIGGTENCLQTVVLKPKKIAD